MRFYEILSLYMLKHPINFHLYQFIKIVILTVQVSCETALIITLPSRVKRGLVSVNDHVATAPLTLQAAKQLAQGSWDTIP